MKILQPQQHQYYHNKIYDHQCTAAAINYEHDIHIRGKQNKPAFLQLLQLTAARPPTAAVTKDELMSDCRVCQTENTLTLINLRHSRGKNAKAKANSLHCKKMSIFCR